MQRNSIVIRLLRSKPMFLISKDNLLCEVLYQIRIFSSLITTSIPPISGTGRVSAKNPGLLPENWSAGAEWRLWKHHDSQLPASFWLNMFILSRMPPWFLVA